MKLTHWRARLLRISRELTLSSASPDSVTIRRAPPSKGWIRNIRDALNMNGYQLARRVGVRQSTIARFEQKERDATVTLQTLRRVADALECDLVYAFVPRVPLIELVAEQVRRAVGDVEDAAELERELLVRVPRWIWGDVAHPELFDRAPSPTRLR